MLPSIVTMQCDPSAAPGQALFSCSGLIPCTFSGPPNQHFVVLWCPLPKKRKHLPLHSTPFLPTSYFSTLYSQLCFLTDLCPHAISSSSPFIKFPARSHLLPTPSMPLKLPRHDAIQAPRFNGHTRSSPLFALAALQALSLLKYFTFLSPACCFLVAFISSSSLRFWPPSSSFLFTLFSWGWHFLPWLWIPSLGC